MNKTITIKPRLLGGMIQFSCHNIQGHPSSKITRQHIPKYFRTTKKENVEHSVTEDTQRTGIIEANSQGNHQSKWKHVEEMSEDSDARIILETGCN